MRPDLSLFTFSRENESRNLSLWGSYRNDQTEVNRKAF